MIGFTLVSSSLIEDLSIVSFAKRCSSENFRGMSVDWKLCLGLIDLE